MALPPRAQAAASESDAKLSFSSVTARHLMVAYACSTGSGSTSGTFSSTTYTSSRGSLLSSELGFELLFIDAEEKLKRLERAKHLAKEFCHGDGDGDVVGVLGRWLSEMGVGWVLDLADDPSAGKTILLRAQPQRDNLAERWIWAIARITEPTNLDSLHSLRLVVAEGSLVRVTDVPGFVQLLRFVEETVLKMLPFVDILLAAAHLDASTETADVSNGVQAPAEKLKALLGVRDAVSGGIQLCAQWRFWAEIEAQGSKLLSLLSEKEQMLEEAMWNTMEEVRNGILNDDSEWSIQTSQGSADIWKVTRSLVTYIKSLWGDYWRLNDIVRAAAKLGSYVPNRDIKSRFLISADQDKASPLTTLALEMVSSLEVKLAKRSKSFPDHSLRFLFLINNAHFIQQQLHPLFRMKYHIAVLTPKIEDCIQKYLQLSWALVMTCLYNHTPRWFRRNNSALPKFHLEFEKTYTAQKLWKVPDPKLRTRLRKAIVEEVIPGLTGYLTDNNVTSPGVTPQEREEMLLELFEG